VNFLLFLVRKEAEDGKVYTKKDKMESVYAKLSKQVYSKLEELRY
jgi:hypothetical protein